MSLIPQIIRMQVESKCTRELCLSSLLAVFRRLIPIYSIWFYFVSKIYPWMSRPNNQSTGKKEILKHVHSFQTLFFSFIFKMQENILFSSRNNKYTIFLYEQNAQFTKVATECSTSYTVLFDCMHSTHLSQSYNCY